MKGSQLRLGGTLQRYHGGMMSILDFRKAWKKREEAKYVDLVSLLILDFCKEYGFNNENFLEICEDQAEEGKVSGIKNPVTGEIILGFFKFEGLVYFVDAEKYHELMKI